MSINLPKFSSKFINQHLSRINSEFEYFRNLELDINISRGIPALNQLALSQALLDESLKKSYFNEEGIDCRNYGFHQGLIELRRLFSPLIGLPPEQIVAHGNSSLTLMFECVAQAWQQGMIDSDQPWSQIEGGISFICAVPGYDRHFAICEYFDIRMISVPMLENGPDIELIKSLVANDSSIKGMWCVPKYSNPTGIVYSDKIIETLASMPTAAKDFRLFWDNAYMIHGIADSNDEIKNIYDVCVNYGNENRALVFASTSKMTLPGSGVAFLASSKNNINWWLKGARIRNVGPDKVNQLKQLRFFKDIDHIMELMAEHQKILKPKFDLVDKIFSERLKKFVVISWTKPRGGYFISLNVIPGTASIIVELAKQLGVIFSTPGSCFPYGLDENDGQLRIAPSFPDIESLEFTLQVICSCIEKASFEYLNQIDSSNS